MGHVMFAEHKKDAGNRQAIREMYRLRHKVFHERMGWKVKSIDGMERDEFDKANPVYVLVKDDEGALVGSWRLLPTTGPYMLKDVFSQLLHGQSAPQQAKVWELSRFAVATDSSSKVGFGFGEISMDLIQASVKFAQENGIHRLIAVTSVAVERMFCKLGVSVTRLGPPIRIGNVLTVASALEIDDITNFALFGTLSGQAEGLAA